VVHRRHEDDAADRVAEEDGEDELHQSGRGREVAQHHEVDDLGERGDHVVEVAERGREEGEVDDDQSS
jgi:hypothetical protein